jgi:hypothetical protein
LNNSNTSEFDNYGNVKYYVYDENGKINAESLIPNPSTEITQNQTISPDKESSGSGLINAE